MIEWTTGDSTGMDGLGGREAEVGYDAGDGVTITAYICLVLQKLSTLLAPAM